MGKLDQEAVAGVDLSNAKTMVCEKCGHKIFTNGFIFKTVSAIYTGTGKPGIVPIPVFQCASCGHVNETFIPEEIRDEFKD